MILVSKKFNLERNLFKKDWIRIFGKFQKKKENLYIKMIFLGGLKDLNDFFYMYLSYINFI